MSLPGDEATIVYLADDLTGATSSAALLVEAGLREVHVLGLEHLEVPPSQAQAYVINVASRDGTESQAKERLQMAVTQLKEVLKGRHLLWGKRIDSTLRGHIIGELKVLRTVLPEGGPLLVAPAFPQADRKTINGYQHVGKQPVNELENVDEAYLPNLLTCLGLNAHKLSLEMLRNDQEPAVLTQLDRNDALVADAEENSDLMRFASWTLESWRRGAIIVDSGPYLGQLASVGLKQGLWPATLSANSPIVVLLGSRSSLTLEQIAHLERSEAKVLKFCSPFDPSHLLQAREADVVLLTANSSGDINDSLSELSATVRYLLTALKPPYALVVSGGRTAFDCSSSLVQTMHF